MPGAKDTARCIFEFVYFARPDSKIFGKSVYRARKKFGERLAGEFPFDGDIVVPIPDSGNISALGFSQKRNMPFEMGIVRNHYIGRTFIEPEQDRRDISVRIKLNAVEQVIRGKRVIVIDDSIVRGTTCRGRMNALKAAGAKEVHMRVSCPPIKFPCYYGIDFPTRSELIAGRHSLEEIRRFIGATTLKYLDKEKMLSCVSGKPENYCTACFDGSYLTNIPKSQSKYVLER